LTSNALGGRLAAGDRIGAEKLTDEIEYGGAEWARDADARLADLVSPENPKSLRSYAFSQGPVGQT
jgi:hypothetical protein